MAITNDCWFLVLIFSARVSTSLGALSGALAQAAAAAVLTLLALMVARTKKLI